MTNTNPTSYSVTCWPGHQSTAFGQEIRPGQWAVVLRLDPVDMVITQAPFPEGTADFVRWCRQLSRAAGQVATQVENTAADSRMPRHYLDKHTELSEQADGGEQGW